MDAEKTDPSEMNELFNSWTKSIMNVWADMYRPWFSGTNGSGEEAALGADPTGSKIDAKASIDAAVKSWQNIATAMSAPESIESLLKGAGTMPEMLAKLAQSTLSGFMQLQETFMERTHRLGESVEAYKFEDLDENMFKAWSQVYETEFSQFFKIPQLGLTRTYQEKVNLVADKYHRFQATVAEFLRLLSLPIPRSISVMQEQVGELAEKGKLPQDSQTYYRMWVKVLEGHYMKLFQTQEYIDTFAKTLSSMSDFMMARDAALEDMLTALPVAKRKELDDVEKEVYLLKKRIRKLEKQIQKSHTVG